MRYWLCALVVGILLDVATTYIGTRIDPAYEQDAASIVLMGHVGIVGTALITLALVGVLAWCYPRIRRGKGAVLVLTALLALERWVAVLTSLLWLHEVL